MLGVGGGWGGGECNITCLVSQPIPLDVAAYSKVLIQRQGLIQQQLRPPQSVPQTGPLEVIEEWSGQDILPSKSSGR